ncbi:unnamed protein product, partial [Polarella glacialis]
VGLGTAHGCHSRSCQQMPFAGSATATAETGLPAGRAACAGVLAYFAMAAVRNRKWRLATRLRLATAEVANGKVSASETPVPVWVINLDKSVDRWEQCLKEFATEHVHAERFPATYGKTLPKDELKEKVTFGCRYFCTPGMIGCFLSHRRIWERALSEGHAAVVALEDDVVLYPNFNKRLTSILSELPPDWD